MDNAQSNNTVFDDVFKTLVEKNAGAADTGSK